jgi:hypothetical protein
MGILVVVLEMLVMKVLRSIFKNRVNGMFNSSPALKRADVFLNSSYKLF